MARERKFSIIEMFMETKNLLLAVGYDRFTISLLAEALNVSRAAIYKYYMNKEELIMDFMISEMLSISEEVDKINVQDSFEKQLDELLRFIFAYKDIHHILGMSHVISDNGSESMIQKKQKLEQMHMSMYSSMQRMIEVGKREGVLNELLPNSIILSFIFQSIKIPNLENLPETEFMDFIKKMICDGINQHENK